MKPYLRLVPAALITLFVVGGLGYARLNSSFDADTPVDVPYLGPTSGLPLGTDNLGRDVLDRLLVGGAGLLAISLALASVVTALGALLGALAALRPWADRLLSLLTDAAILIPTTLGMLVLGSSLPDAGAVALLATGILLGTPYCAKVFHAAAHVTVLSGHVNAAQGIGETTARLIFVEMLPHLRRTALTIFGLRLVEATYLVATAAFLQVPTGLPSTNWAESVRNNGGGLFLNPWAALAPAFTIAFASIAITVATHQRAARKVVAVRDS